MVINNELKFAEKVILIDAAYINKVTKDLSQHFGQLIGRELPKADLPIFLECVAMDAAIQPGENVLQVLFVYDKNQTRIDAFNPSDLKKELNDVAFKSQLGEFQLNTFEPSDMADKEAFFFMIVPVCLIAVYSDERESCDKFHALTQNILGRDIVSIIVHTV